MAPEEERRVVPPVGGGLEKGDFLRGDQDDDHSEACTRLSCSSSKLVRLIRKALADHNLIALR